MGGSEIYCGRGRSIRRPLRQKSLDTRNETSCRLDSDGGLFWGDHSLGPQLVIGNRLHVKGLRQETPQLNIDARLILRESSERHMSALVRLGILPCALGDEGLSRVECRKVRVARSVLSNT